MPTITTTPVQGYAHCRDSLCPGNEQEQVPALREQADLYYKEWDPDGVPGVMNSTARFMFADPGDAACPHCGESREVTDQVRPVYPVMTSQLDGVKSTDQRFLLDLQKRGLLVEPGSAGGGGASSESAELAELRRELAEMRGFIAGQRAAQNPAGEAENEGDNGADATPPRRRRRSQPEEPTQ